MPEEIEIDTERARELAHEAGEAHTESGSDPSGRVVRRAALTTALLAAVAAIASLEAGATINDALTLKTEAATLQARASDQWAYYQAKGIKATVNQAAQSTWEAAGKRPPAQLGVDAARYLDEQKKSGDEARAFEKERDAKSAEADALRGRHHGFAAAVAFLQVAIAVGAVAALARSNNIWLSSLVLGFVGATIFLWNLISGGFA